LQPFISRLPRPAQPEGQTPANSKNDYLLQFVLYFSDPDHQLTHATVTQAVPSKWVDIWDQHDWIEDHVVEALRVGVEVIGQEYIVARMGWIKDDAAGSPPEESAEAKTN